MHFFLLSVFYLVIFTSAGIHAQHPRQQALKLYLSSLCKPRETLVKVEDEFPELMHSRVVPSCVPLQRCGGCCLDEAMVCVNVAKYNTTIQLQQYAMDLQGNMVVNTIELLFVEHSQCQCRLIEDQ